VFLLYFYRYFGPGVRKEKGGKREGEKGELQTFISLGYWRGKGRKKRGGGWPLPAGSDHFPRKGKEGKKKGGEKEGGNR